MHLINNDGKSNSYTQTCDEQDNSVLKRNLSLSGCYDKIYYDETR